MTSKRACSEIGCTEATFAVWTRSMGPNDSATAALRKRVEIHSDVRANRHSIFTMNPISLISEYHAA